MQFLTATIYAACMSLVLVSGQLFGGNFGFGYNAVSGDFGGPSAFGGSLGVGPNNVRDPRQNRGPVVFPDPPTDGPMESSGVIVGASGFGFVPPSGHGQQSRYTTRFSNLRYFNQFRYF